MSVWDRYRAYLETPPEDEVEWQDPATGARGWLVMNSLRGGAAGGGTRMRRGLTRDEVVHLAKTMELKFAFSGPGIGGAKSGIAFDPGDPRRREVLRRWFREIRPRLRTCYGTAGDLNVRAEQDVVPLCAELGLHHPQEGVLRGHFRPPPESLRAICRALASATRQVVNGSGLGPGGREYRVTDLVTGYGVARAAAHLQRRRGESLESVRMVVEGFGSVGGAAALYLAREGAQVVGIVDASRAIVAPEGLTAREVEELLARREGTLLPPHPNRVEGRDRERVYDVPADLFVPAAISGSLYPERLEQLRRAGVRTIVCAANHPFREERVGDTRVQEMADREFRIVADAVGGLGMARTFACLMRALSQSAADPGEEAGNGGSGEAGAGSGRSVESTGGLVTAAECTDPEHVFREVDAAAREAVDAVVERAEGEGTGLLAAAVGVALDRVEA